MDRHRRTSFEVDGTIEAGSLAGSLGRELRAAARRRRLTQAEIGRRVGLSASRIGEIQRGRGASASLETWVKLGKAVGRPLAVSFSRAMDLHEAHDAAILLPRSSSSASPDATAAAPTSSCRRDLRNQRVRSTSPFATMAPAL
jgi:transcriptional regulator with XRE-family HTH domain